MIRAIYRYTRLLKHYTRSLSLFTKVCISGLLMLAVYNISVMSDVWYGREASNIAAPAKWSLNANFKHITEISLEPELPSISVETVILVNSPIVNIEQRDAVRVAWKKHIRDTSVMVCFVSVLSSNGTGIPRYVGSEAQSEKDVLVLKSVYSGNKNLDILVKLEWLHSRLFFDTVFIIDDHSLVNVDNLRKQLVTGDKTHMLGVGSEFGILGRKHPESKEEKDRERAVQSTAYVIGYTLIPELMQELDENPGDMNLTEEARVTDLAIRKSLIITLLNGFYRSSQELCALVTPLPKWSVISSLDSYNMVLLSERLKKRGSCNSQAGNKANWTLIFIIVLSIILKVII